VNLALQGGAAATARFTWGYSIACSKRSDRLSKASPERGAVNAVVLADGLAAGSREGARQALRVYWQKISTLSSRSVLSPSAIDKANSDFGLEPRT
jgi:NTE family protein